MTIKEREIPLEYDAFVAVYNEANANAKKALSGRQSAAEKPATAAPAPEPKAEVAAVDKGTGAIVGATPEEQKAEEALADAVKAEEKADADAKEMAGGGTPVEPNTGEAEPPAADKPKVRVRKRRTAE